MNREKQYQEAIENTLSLDDTFEFKCSQCGKCCGNRSDLLLNPHDVFAIAKHLGLTCKEVISRYCDFYIGMDSKLFVVRIAPSVVCPFMSCGKCSIHSAKPLICKLYPLGRFYGQDGNITYFLQPVTCGERGGKISLRQWLKEFEIAENDVIGKEWLKAAMELSLPLVGKELPIRTQFMLYRNMFELLYCKYDTNGDFIEQLRRNVQELKGLYNELSIE